VLGFDGHSAVLDHKAEVIEGDSDHEHRHVEANRASLQQIDCEEERVVVFACVQFLCIDQLVHLSHFRIQDGPVLVLLWLPFTLVFTQVQDNLSDEKASAENGREVVREVSRIVLLRADPVLDEARRFHERAEVVESLHELLVWLLGGIIFIAISLRRRRFIRAIILNHFFVLFYQLLDGTLTRCMATTEFILKSVCVLIFKLEVVHGGPTYVGTCSTGRTFTLSCLIFS